MFSSRLVESFATVSQALSPESGDHFYQWDFVLI